MNFDDDMKILEGMKKMKEEGRIPYGMEFIAKDIFSRPIPDVLALLVLFKAKNKEAGDLLCDSVLTSILLSYCQTIDEAMAMVNSLKDSLCKYDKYLNTPQE